MKRLFAIAISLVGLNAMADTVILAPGSSAEVTANQTTTVSCKGTPQELPVCKIVATAAPFTVYVGSSAMIDSKTLDDAISNLKKFRDAGLCQ